MPVPPTNGGSNLNKMRKALAERKAAPFPPVVQGLPQSAPPPQPKVKQQPPQSPSKTVPAGDPPPDDKVIITFQCGCRVGAAQWTRQDCPQCRSHKRQAKNKIKSEQGRLKSLSQLIFRLPPGSTKHLVWDGTLWTGTLTVPDIPTPFTAIGTGEKKCLHALHSSYATYLAQNNSTNSVEPPPVA